MNKTVIAIGLALAVPALTTLAQPGPGGGHRPPPSPVIMALDANGDGVIDAQEIANAPAALAGLDKNGDGQLTQDELRPPRPQGQDGANNSNRNNQRRSGQQNGGSGEGPEGRPPAPPLIAALDSNGDGKIDAQELANASASLLTLDKNGDGQLTFEEFCPPPPDGGHGSHQ